MLNRILDVLGVLGLVATLASLGYYCYWHMSIIDAMALGM